VVAVSLKKPLIKESVDSRGGDGLLSWLSADYKSVDSRGGDGLLSWLSADYKKLTGRMTEIPTRADVPLAVQEQLIVELYSK
jgi:ribosomal protein S4